MGEPQEENDLFFVCSFIEYIARTTHNTKEYIVNKIGKEKINKIYNLAEVYHCENIDKITDEIISESNIQNGNYILKTYNDKPTFWVIGKVYQRLILMLCDYNKNEFINVLYDVLTSWIIEKIDNYESSMYYETPEYIYECYKNNKIL